MNNVLDEDFRFLFKHQLPGCVEIRLVSSILELDFLKMMRYIP